MLPPRELADVMALKSLRAGNANEDQQKRAFDYIVNEICGVQYLAFDHESARNTDFMLGRQFVAHTILKFVRLNADVFKQETGKND